MPQKSILIIIFLTIIVGGGILVYWYWWLPEEESEISEMKPTEVKTPEEIPVPPEEILPTKIPSDWKTYKNEEYGFEIKYPRDFKEYSSKEVYFPLEKTTGIRVLCDEKLSISLSGSIGGRYYYHFDPKDPFLSNRVFSEKIILNDIVTKGEVVFKKDYWAVYGGMGSWDVVILCYTKYKNNYYMISLEDNVMGGVPGAVTEDGKKITKEEIIDVLFKRMLDSEKKKYFDQMFLTFRFLD